MRARFICRLGMVLTAFGASCRSEPHSEVTRAGAGSTLPERPLQPGDTAPDFSALSHIGYAVTPGDFTDRPLLVQVCPTGFNASCTELARSLRNHWLALNQRLAMALFVVPLSYADSRAFASAEELPFMLLTDTDGAIAASFGVRPPAPGASNDIGFLIGKGRAISHVLRGLGPEENIAELSRLLP